MRLFSFWLIGLIPVRDSWVESSDFERAQQLLRDSLQWVSFERQKLQQQGRLILADKRNQAVEIAALKKQDELRMITHETESFTLSKSAKEVIDVMRRELHEVRVATEEKIIRLESSIVELSRECQQADFLSWGIRLFVFLKRDWLNFRLGRHSYRRLCSLKRSLSCCGLLFIHYRRLSNRYDGDDNDKSNYIYFGDVIITNYD